MDKIQVIISNKSLLAEDFYANGSVSLEVESNNEVITLLDIALKNDCNILMRNKE